jgi:hypothetical protein
MKQIYFLTAILFLNGIQSFAQTTDVITNVAGPTSLTLIDNELFFGNFNGNLRKVDVTTSNPPETVVASNGIYRSFLSGNTLYFTENNAGRISKIDITESNPERVDVLTGLASPRGIFIDGNTLYFSEAGNSQVSKIDITETNPTATIFSNQFNAPTGIALIGNDLYVAEFFGNKISKIDITQTSPSPVNVVTNLNNPTDVIVNGNTLLVAEVGSNKVIRIDVSASTPEVSNLVTNIDHPTGLFVHGTDLYISVYDDNKIVKFSSTILEVQNVGNSNQNIKLFPNPSSNAIQISGLTKTAHYRIYNMLGAKISDGIISDNYKINIQSLTNGLYFLKFDNGNTLKFLKK